MKKGIVSLILFLVIRSICGIYKVYISNNKLYLTSKKQIAASKDVCRVCCCQVFLYNLTQTRRHLEDIRANFLSQHYTQVADWAFMRYPIYLYGTKYLSNHE